MSFTEITSALSGADFFPGVSLESWVTDQLRCCTGCIFPAKFDRTFQAGVWRGEADGNQMFGGHLSDTSEQFVLSDYPCDQSGDSPPWAGKQAWLAPSRMAKTREALRAVCVCTCAGRVFPEKAYESCRNSCLGYLHR